LFFICQLILAIFMPFQTTLPFQHSNNCFIFFATATNDAPYGMINRVLTDCEYVGINVGSELSDAFNAMDEATEFDIRVHSDYVVEHTGFAGFLQSGTWKNTALTANKQSAPALQKKGGWNGRNNVGSSSYWALENKWVYLMGDSTMRQIWAAFQNPLQNREFEKNAKEWAREKCIKQLPHRKSHPIGQYFDDEGWGAPHKCALNEVTCHLPGFGADGKVTWDWKHFPYEDYDEWVFGDTGVWSANASEHRPDILVIQMTLHTCVHALDPHRDGHYNASMIQKHEEDVGKLMRAVKSAVDRPPKKTTVIVMTGGRNFLKGNDPRANRCQWRLNRIAAHEAHLQGFPVFEREEIEHRLLFKSEFSPYHKNMNTHIHLDIPGPQIISTALLAMVACIARNGSDSVGTNPLLPIPTAIGA